MKEIKPDITKPQPPTETALEYPRSVKTDDKDVVEDIAGEEVVLLKDEKSGVLVQLNSNKIRVDKLLVLTTEAYDFLLKSRTKG